MKLRLKTSKPGRDDWNRIPIYRDVVSDQIPASAASRRPSLLRLLTSAATTFRSESSERGIALIIVMIAILVLASLAGGFAIAMKVETTLARNANSETELEWLGRSGAEYCRWILAQSEACSGGPRYDALNQVWAGGAGGSCMTNSPLVDVQRTVTLGRGTFTWKISDCERKWNINSLIGPAGMSPQAADIFKHACMEAGADPGEIPGLTGAVTDWIDPDDTTTLDGAESEFYQSLTPPYYAKNGPIDDISELLLIRGITQDLYWGAASTNHQIGSFQAQRPGFNVNQTQPPLGVGFADLFTAVSSGKININTASSAVIQMTGVDSTIADAIVAAREGEDDGSGLLGPYRTPADINRVPGMNPEIGRIITPYIQCFSTAFEVQVDAQIGNYKRTFKAVVGRNPQNPKDVQILTFNWQ